MNLPGILNSLKALRDLGPTQAGLFALYKLGLKTGWFARQQPAPAQPAEFAFDLPLPDPDEIKKTIGAGGLKTLLAEADEIASGKFRQFGGSPVEIRLNPGQPLRHWAAYETDHALLRSLNLPHNDIKFLWEPARFGWAFTLGRAWHLTGDEKYATCFWQNFEQFQAANPPFLGPNWMSGQEAALRLIAFAWAGVVFRQSAQSTPQRLADLAVSVARHAERIPPTLLYGRAQNNNHLLTEAAGLYTASLVLPAHPQAVQWQRSGWTWLNWCFAHQIDVYGEYTQHSSNYHRLMLQIALWVSLLARSCGRNFSRAALENLALATHWLYGMLDPVSGQAPNLGANDGANIFPLSSQPFDDYRPVVQAAARAYMQYSLPAGPWDEMALWFGLPASNKYFEAPRYTGDHLYTPESWAMLRAVRRFRSRPSHADQLHLDLWWQGLNIARDAGSYLYNADAPWDNRLTSTLVHNTVSVDGQEQMTRASRFLYLDWAGATVRRRLAEDADVLQLAARTDAYRRVGVRHDRVVTALATGHWRVEDDLLNLRLKPHRFRLHWLLPDWEWKLETIETGLLLALESPHGPLQVRVVTGSANPLASLDRAGERLHGLGEPAVQSGWESPTYSIKIPALALAVEVESPDNVRFVTEFSFPSG
jgi:hypothetical protein